MRQTTTRTSRARQAGTAVVALAAVAGVLAGCTGSGRAPTTGPVSPAPSSPSPTPGTTVVEGRPARRGRRVLAPSLRESRPDVRTPLLPIPSEQTLSALPVAARLALAERWSASARGELGSVPAFAELSVTLSALGAPLELVTRVHQAALDEVDHARRCLAIAGAYRGSPVSAGPMPGLLSRRRRPGGALAHLAVETLRDGCLLESYAAVLMHRASATAGDAALAESLSVIAADETRHGELSWDVLAWCLEVGGPWVRARVAWALRHLPTESGRPVVRDCAPALAEQHGWPREAHDPRHFAAHRAQVVQRAAALLVDGRASG